MTDLTRACRYAAIALSLATTTFGPANAGTSEGGYNTMGKDVAYYDSGHDRANAAAMLLALGNSANFYRDGYWDSSHHWHYSRAQSATNHDRNSGGDNRWDHR